MNIAMDQPAEVQTRGIFRVATALVLLSNLAFLFAATPPPALVPNGDFEAGGASWGFMANNANSTGGSTTEQVHSGKQAYKITNASGFAPHVYGRAFLHLTGLDPFTTYHLTCYVKGRGVGICWIGGGPGWTHRQRFPEGTFDWQKVETDFTTDAGGDYDLMIVSESQTEALYVDDVTAVATSADTAKRDQVLSGFETLLSSETANLARVQALVKSTRGAKDDAIVRLGLAVARRYVERAGTTSTRQSRAWSVLQLMEVDDVLSETQAELARVKYRATRPQPYATGGSVTIEDGMCYTDTTVGAQRPFFFYGMGHFDQLYRDLPNWHNLGVSMLQDGRCGPSSMNEDGSLRPGARHLLTDIKSAAQYQLKMDYLLSPHYFPEWAGRQRGAEGLNAGGLGFISFDIDHPIAQRAIQTWANKISAALRLQPALLSVCLSNEPVYDDSGRTTYSLPLYRDYLRETHKRISALNESYGSSYKSFDEVLPPPNGFAKDDNRNRAYFDWCHFNNKHFADWHAWMRAAVHKNLPSVPTHAKIMVFSSLDRDKLGWGVDPEQFCDRTEIAGCDAYAFPGADFKTFDWHGHAFWYDLLNSFHNQPVFNSENHIIPDGTGPAHIPMNLTRAQFWEGALHHQGLTTTWVWEEASDPSLNGSIYFRPANVFGAGRAFLEINRFAEELAAINQAPAQVALLYSPASVFWSDKYVPALHSIYTQLNFLGQKVTFVSERQLAETRAPKVHCIIAAHATNVTSETVAALGQFAERGGKLIYVGDENLSRDEYNRPHGVSATFIRAIRFKDGKRDLDSAMRLHDVLTSAGLKLMDVETSDGKHAWNVEYRTVAYEAGTLMPLMNFAANAQTIKLPEGFAGATELLSGERVNEQLSMEPMIPYLLFAKSGSALTRPPTRRR